jgi:hypothetical protein
MSDANAFDFLNTEGDEEAEVEVSLPEGAGSFPAFNLICKGRMRMGWSFWSRENVTNYPELEADGLAENMYEKRGKPDSWFYFFPYKHAKVASTVADYFDSSSMPCWAKHVWQFTAPSETIKNYRGDDTPTETFGAFITRDCQVQGWRSKYRHEFLLMALPAAVDALARFSGLIEDQIFHLRELTDGGMRDEDYTLSFQARMIGDDQADGDDLKIFNMILEVVGDDYERAYDIALGSADSVPDSVSAYAGITRIHWSVSRLRRRQVELWAALGENNPDAYIRPGQARSDRGKKYETTSEALAQCLAITRAEWAKPMWMKVFFAPDPRKEAVYGAGRRLSRPVIAEFYGSEEEAMAAVEADSPSDQEDKAEAPKTEKNDVAPAPISDATKPNLPSNWAKYPDKWAENLKKQKILAEDLPIPPDFTKIAETLTVEEADVTAWWDFV